MFILNKWDQQTLVRYDCPPSPLPPPRLSPFFPSLPNTNRPTPALSQMQIVLHDGDTAGANAANVDQDTPRKVRSRALKLAEGIFFCLYIKMSVSHA